MWENLTVGGFHFDSAAEYADAKHEQQTIEYLSARMDINKPEIALKVYLKLLDRQDMKTIVGLSFLKKLRDCVVDANIVDEEELKSIHAPETKYADLSTETGDEISLENSSGAEEFSKEVDEALPASENNENDNPGDEIRRLTRDISMYKDKEQKQKNIADFYRLRNKKLYIFIAALIIIIGVLFGTAIHNNNLIFMDEEMAVQDKYAAWEEELQAREAAIKEREDAIR